MKVHRRSLRSKNTMKNATFARHAKVMGLLKPEWSLARSASTDTGWTSLGRTLRYDMFSADIRRGDVHVQDTPFNDFVASTAEQKGTAEAFAKETSEMLEVNLRGRTWARGETAMSFKAFLGRGSGENFQLAFGGDGWVIVQPYEEKPLQQEQGRKKNQQPTGKNLLGQLLGG